MTFKLPRIIDRQEAAYESLFQDREQSVYEVHEKMVDDFLCLNEMRLRDPMFEEICRLEF